MNAGSPESSDTARFFEHGQIAFMERDFPNRQARIDITMPCCLFQTVSPTLLGAGYIDDPQIHNPMVVWMPQLSASRVNILAKDVVDAHDKMNRAIQERIDLILKTYEGMSHFLIDPSDIIPMLPLGTYVDFKFRCRIDDLMKVLENIQPLISITGVAEFQWALASVFACVLQDIQTWEHSQSLKLKQNT